MNKRTLPNHIAIIPDGNRRWAKEHGLPKFEGHRRGYEVAVKIAKKIKAMGISTFTFWAFSTENWNRSREEVSYLMKLLDSLIDRYAKDVLGKETRFTHLGRKDRLPKGVVEKLSKLEEQTKQFGKHYFNLALDYGGRDEIIRAIGKILRVEPLKGFNPRVLSEGNFDQFLDTAGQPYPNPDLIIRTSGEMRTSGFMIWQAAYAEWVFLDKYFPDLTEKDIDYALEEYARRQRRFGK